jgi:hypothetical protein
MQGNIFFIKSLKYRLNPPTPYIWANKVMQQWDIFIDANITKQFDSSYVSVYFANHQPQYFKKIDQGSYKNFRQVSQLLDCAILDIQTVQFQSKILVCSLLYLVLGNE